MRYMLTLFAGLLFSGFLYSAELFVGLSRTEQHVLWDKKPSDLCEVDVKNNKLKGGLYLPCSTIAQKVRFFESGAINITVDIEPTAIGPRASNEGVSNSAVYQAARKKILEMGEKDKKFKKDLEKSTALLFDDKGFLLPDVMYIPMPIETIFVMYVQSAGALKGTVEQLRNY
jgi:hypothetical protein